MTDNNIWYLPGPFHRYEDDVKAIAKKEGLIIIDANVTEDRGGEVEKPPKAKLKPEFRPASKAPTADPREKLKIEELHDALTKKGVTFDSNADQPTLLQLLKDQD
ncbi:hypothetical protein KJF94_07230 [Pseudomonas hormoni]|uniref:HeH/LEM domain-containing protein n=1 Tax=Pseudomonas hormoni TaxID=3093767 RepID=A0ABX8F0D1_9PSED|nr:hypothetical protein [Pseudomonas hormoni]QVW25359.1 hypothetical protein KJF94_07230 [Pseudomonas hormoni]